MSDHPPPGAPGGYGPPPGHDGYGPYASGGYSVGGAFSYGFAKFGANWAPLVLITLLLVVGAGLTQVVGNVLTAALSPGVTFDFETGQYEDDGGGLFRISFGLSLVFSAMAWTTQTLIQSAIVKGSLDVTRGHRFDLGAAFSGINWGQVVIAALLTGAMTFVGLLLCLVPGIAVIFFTSYTLFFVIDRGQDAVSAIKSSVRMVRDNLGDLTLFFLASLAALIVGACLCGVGLLAAIPIVVIAQAYTFRTFNDDQVTA